MQLAALDALRRLRDNVDQAIAIFERLGPLLDWIVLQQPQDAPGSAPEPARPMDDTQRQRFRVAWRGCGGGWRGERRRHLGQRDLRGVSCRVRAAAEPAASKVLLCCLPREGEQQASEGARACAGASGVLRAS